MGLWINRQQLSSRLGPACVCGRLHLPFERICHNFPNLHCRFTNAPPKSVLQLATLARLAQGRSERDARRARYSPSTSQSPLACRSAPGA